MATNNTNAAFAVPVGDLDIERGLDSCGSSHEALRAYVLACRRSARWALDAQLYRVLNGKGYDATDLCARELGARLDDITVCELLQTISMGRKDAIVEIFHGPLASRIWCSGGEIVDAESGRLKGESAIYRILALDHGEVLADFRPVVRPRSLRSSTSALMLEALRRKDECAVLEKRLGGTQRVYSSVAAARSAVDTRGLEWALLDAFKTGARIESVLASSALDDLAMLQAVSALVERGSLVANDTTPTLVPRPMATPLPAKVYTSCSTPPPTSALRRIVTWQVFGVFAASALSALLLAWVLGAPSEPDVVVHTTEMALTDPNASAEGLGRLSPRAAEPSDSDTRPPPAQSPASVEERGTTYPVQVMVEPAGAELWLDGTWLATGELSVILVRNGRTHELRIVAPEHHPQTFLFCDAAPPRAVRLVPEDERHPELGTLEQAPASPELPLFRAIPISRLETPSLAPRSRHSGRRRAHRAGSAGWVPPGRPSP